MQQSKNKLYFLKSDYNKYVIKKIIEYLLKGENSIENIWEKKELIVSIDYVSIYTFSLSTLAEFFSVMDSDEYENYFIMSINKMLQWILNNEKKGDSIRVTFYNDNATMSGISSNYYDGPLFSLRMNLISMNLYPIVIVHILVFSVILSLRESLT